MPSASATASAVARLSPVIMTTRMPSLRSAASASRVVLLIGSAMAKSPNGLPSIPANTIVCPSLRSATASASRLRDVDAAVVEEGHCVAGEHDVAIRSRRRHPGR